MRLRTAITVLVAIGMIAPAAAAPAISGPTSTAPASSTPTPAATSAGSASGGGGGAAAEANYTRLYVNDGYAHLRIKPGESDSFVVTVENGEDDTVDVTPDLVAPQVRQRPVDESWVSIDADNVTLEPGAEREFTVTVSVPEDAELDRYQGAVAFTDETVRYPGQPPQPVHAASFNVEVWREPTVDVVAGDYLYAQVEAGEQYTHSVVIENTGDQSVPVNPQLGTERRAPAHSNDDGLQRSWFDIDAPNEIAPGETATVEVTVAPPEDAALDRYRAELDLGLKDPARPDGSDYWQRVNMNIQVWQQPDEPFETEFAVSEEAESVALELSAARNHRASTTEPASFDVTFVSPNGTAFDAERVRTTTQGSVDLGADNRPDVVEDDSGYSTGGERQTFRYRIDAPDEGTWSVRIMPENTMRFDYEIVRDESG